MCCSVLARRPRRRSRRAGADRRSAAGSRGRPGSARNRNPGTSGWPHDNRPPRYRWRLQELHPGPEEPTLDLLPELVDNPADPTPVFRVGTKIEEEAPPPFPAGPRAGRSASRPRPRPICRRCHPRPPSGSRRGPGNWRARAKKSRRCSVRRRAVPWGARSSIRQKASSSLATAGRTITAITPRFINRKRR